MAMAQRAPAPKPNRVNLAKLTLEFPLEYDEQRSHDLGQQYLGLIAEQLASRRKPFYFQIDGRDIELRDFRLEIDSVEPGSTIVRLSVVAGFVLGTYHAIAVYPDFKDGAEELKQDLSRAVEYVIENRPPFEDNDRIPVRMDVVLREEDVLAVDLGV